MRVARRVSLGLRVAAGLCVLVPVTVSAQGTSTPPSVTGPPLPPEGATEVHYSDRGALTATTRIPEGSAFLTAGGGSGGSDASPCWTFEWYEEERNPQFDQFVASGWVVDPATGWAYDPADPFQRVSPTVFVSYAQDSTAWRYREVTPTGDWSPEAQGQLDGDGNWTVTEPDLLSALSWGASYYANNAPVATATRRFAVYCGLPERFLADGGEADLPGFGDAMGWTEVGMRDPFWDPFTRLGILWNSVQLPSFDVADPVEVDTYGGLVVNMPAWLQISTDAWRPYFSPVDHYMGWVSQLGLFPAQLDFEVVGPGGGGVPCAPATSTADAEGFLPGMPEDLPDVWTEGQLGWDCSWTPQAPGRVTIRARITYDVLLTIAGYSQWLTPYVWYSEPLILDVGEVRNVNVTPPGGAGG